VIPLGLSAVTSWSYSDANNFDSQSVLLTGISVLPAPEPSSIALGFAGMATLLAARFRRLSRCLHGMAALLSAAFPIWGQVPITSTINIPNMGQQVTPLAPRGSRFTYLNPGLPNLPSYIVGQAVTAVTSPDHKTMLVLTSGYNAANNAAGSRINNTEYIFVYDITRPIPVQTQAIPVANTYNGIVFDPSGTAFYVSGGRNDNVHVYIPQAGVWAETGSPIPLGHTSQAGGTPPEAAGIAITQNASKIVVTNYENDSVSILTKSAGTWSKTADFDLRPGKIDAAQSGVSGGTYPFWVTIKGNDTAYVSSIRDREIVVLNIAGVTPFLIGRIKLKGQPLKSTLNSAQTTLFVAEDQTDSIAVINTANNQVQEIKVAAPLNVLPGALTSLPGNNTNSVTLSPDEATLYVTHGNTNCVAVVNLTQLGSANPVAGLIPTGMYPNSVALSGDGKYMYVVNGKSPSGPNAGYCRGGVLPNLNGSVCAGSNGYSLQTIKAGLQFLPTPAIGELTALTQQVQVNNGYSKVEDSATTATMNFLQQKIKHIIYIIKENRTYDQVLGDLTFGNGDPSLTEFPAAITPNFHNLAKSFVTLDNFYDTSEVSYDGWSWSTSANAPDVVIRQTPVNYSPRGGLSYDSEGDNRGINLLARTGTNASDPNVLPRLTNVAAPDGPGSEVNTGYLWDQALRAGLRVRNYGFFVDNIGSAISNPFASGVIQVRPANAALAPNTDLYFRGYDQNNADFYLYQEWARDFDANFAAGGLPALNLMRLPHDHTGNFGTALAGVNTPELQVADNDYAVGLVVQKIANSIYADSTLIFVIEDDAQNGGDHVDVHRSTAFIVGPYVKHNALVSTQYNTINFIRTMERILGLPPLNLHDAVAQPMADVFDINQAAWSYEASPAPILYNSTLPLPPLKAGVRVPKSTHDSKYWARVTKGLDFSQEDRVEPESFNRIMWKGLMGNKVYPGDANRAVTEARYREALRRRGKAAEDDDDRH
jgi:DNA-binding beta-propeller fold protein YncE